MAESKSSDFVIMLAQSEDGSLLSEVPNQDVRVVSSLPRGDEAALIRDGDASDLIVVASKEELIVRVGQISNNDGGACNHNVVSRIRVEMDTPCDLATIPDSVV